MDNVKRAQVVMLPINKKEILFLKNDKISTYNRVDESILNHNLYIISDNEIKKGDWVSDGITVMKSSPKLIDAQELIGRREWKKIIATTDTSLNISEYAPQLWKYLPQPSQQFIEKYIESYNKGEVITDVLVEYEGVDCEGNFVPNYRMNEGCGKRIKINSKDNTITIKKLKDSWNREEIIILLNKYERNVVEHFYKFNHKDWIKENL